MPTADTARMVASLSLEDKFTQSAQKIEQSVDKLSGSMSGLQKASFVTQAAATATGVALERIAAKGVSLLVEGVQGGIESLTKLEEIQTQTRAAIESTGRAAGLSATQVGDLAQKLEDLTTVDDKVIQAGENVLLRYTAIGKTVFPQAAKAAVDLAVGLAQGDANAANVASAAATLGRALEDPVRGLKALRQAGIILTKQQEDQIKAFAKVNDLVGEQTVVLGAVEKAYGAAGEAAGKGFAADQRRLQDAVEGAQQALARGLLPTLTRLSEWLNTKLRSPEALKFFQKLGENLGKALDAGLAFAQRIPWDSIANALNIAAKAAEKILDLFLSLPPWVQTAVITGWGLNKLTGGGVTKVVGAGAGGIADIIKGAVGGAASGGAGSVVGAVADKFFGRGTIGNPMIVRDISNPLGGAIPGGGFGGAASAGKLAMLIPLVGEAIGLATLVVGTQQELANRSSEQAAGAAEALNKEIAGGASIADLNKSLSAINTGIDNITSNPLLTVVQGDALEQLRGMRKDVVEALGKLGVVIDADAAERAKKFQDDQNRRDAQRGPIPDPQTGRILIPGSPDYERALMHATDDLIAARTQTILPSLASLQNQIGDTRSETALIGHAIDDSINAGFGRTVAVLNALDGDFKLQLAVLKKSTDPAEIAKAAGQITRDILKGAGSSKGTSDVLATLKTQRAAAVKSGDTQLVRIIDSSIKQISPKLANREWVDKQLAILKDIKSDGKITKEESTRLKGIQKDLLSHGDRHAAGIIAAENHVGRVIPPLAGKIDGVKAAQQAAAAAQASAQRQTTEAIKDKDLSVAVTVPVTSITTIRGIGIQQRIYSKYRATAD